MELKLGKTGVLGGMEEPDKDTPLSPNNGDKIVLHAVNFLYLYLVLLQHSVLELIHIQFQVEYVPLLIEWL